MELILGEDDLAAVEDPSTAGDNDQGSESAQVEQQLAELKAEMAEVKALLRARLA